MMARKLVSFGQFCSILVKNLARTLQTKNNTFMARASLYHDCRAVKAGEPGPLKIKYYHKGTTIMVPTTVYLLPEQWAKTTIVNHPRAKQMNSLLQLRMAEVTTEILELEVTGKLADMSPADLRRRLLTVIGHETDKGRDNLFLPVYEEYMGKFDNPGTISIWNNTLNRLKAYCSYAGCELEKLSFDMMTVEWMEAFDSYLALTAPKANARAINHRNIRTVFNYAIKRKKMAVSYPFTDFKIKHQETRHQDLTIEETRLLREYELQEERIAKVRDIFMLMIYLRGINAADLFGAKKAQVIGGRLEYYRCKTGAFASVKIEPEAWEIIRRYEGKDYLLDVAEKWTDTKNYLRRMDKDLKKIGPVTIGKRGKKTYHGLFQKIASNGARHTWASLTAELGYSMDTASEGLTHKFGHRTTNIYVNKRMRMNVDRANRHVIDYILGKEDEIAENANTFAHIAI